MSEDDKFIRTYNAEEVYFIHTQHTSNSLLLDTAPKLKIGTLE